MRRNQGRLVEYEPANRQKSPDWQTLVELLKSTAGLQRHGLSLLNPRSAWQPTQSAGFAQLLARDRPVIRSLPQGDSKQEGAACRWHVFCF